MFENVPKISNDEAKRKAKIDFDIDSVHDIKIIEENTINSQLIRINDYNLEIKRMEKENENLSISLERVKKELEELEVEVKESGLDAYLSSQIYKKEDIIDSLRTKINHNEKMIKQKKRYIENNLVNSN